MVTKYRTETRTRTVMTTETRYRDVPVPVPATVPKAAPKLEPPKDAPKTEGVVPEGKNSRQGEDTIFGLLYEINRKLPDPEPAEVDTILEVKAEDIVLKLEPTPMNAVKDLLRELQPQPGELVVDLGCGDGRFVIEAVKEYGCLGRGIELNTETAQVAMDNAAGVDGVEIIEGDILHEDWSDASIVIMYLYDDLIAEVWPLIPSGTLVASVNHDLPGSCRKV